MEKSLKYRFVFISMASLFAVLLLLFGGINVANYLVVTKSQDNILHSIADSNSRFPAAFPNEPFGAPPSPEARSFTRFFSVRLDRNGNIIDISLNHVSSVTGNNAREYANTVQSKRKTAGYCGEYRFYVYQDGADTVQIFLNCGNQLQFIKILLLLSCLISLLCFFLMFILILTLSKRAISPYVKNMEIQKQFITDASHELKTPLTSISTSADILAYDDSDNEWVRNIQNQTARLSKLVSNLVTMSRLDEKMPIPEKAVFSLSDALWEIVEPFASFAKANGKEFTQQIEDGLSLFGDIVSIQQMVSILLDNATKYSNVGGNIRIDAYRKRQKNIIEVFNTCDMIDTKNLNRLFDRFYRVDTSRSTKIAGTGVGLSIAKAIAKAHDGDISVKSQSGNSIVFTVTL